MPPAHPLLADLAALLAQAAGDPLAIQAIKEIGAFIVSLVTAVGVILITLQSKRTQAKVEEAKQEITSEVRVNTQLTKVVGREAKEAHREAQAAVVHANEHSEKLEALAERQVEMVISDDEEFIQLLARCIANAREVQEQKRKRRGDG